ncbi:MAG: hypothetical protein WC755_07875, partial [Candidatus Woesearchaeota archaeon]
MNKGVVFWILAVLIFLSGVIPINIEIYSVVQQKIPYEKTVHSIEIYFENVTTTKLVSKAIPYNAEGYRTYGETTYELYKEINVSVPYFRYGYGKPIIPITTDVKNGKWLFTFNEDNCTTSFKLYNPNYVPISVLLNYTIVQENKKYWVGERKIPLSENITIEARQYTLPILGNTHREHSYDDKNYEQYFGKGFCNIDMNSFVFSIEDSAFIVNKIEKDYEKLDIQGEKFYEFNYVGTRYVLEKENITTEEKIPHTQEVDKTIIDYKTVDRVIKTEQRMPIYLAAFAMFDSYKIKNKGI